MWNIVYVYSELFGQEERVLRKRGIFCVSVNFILLLDRGGGKTMLFFGFSFFFVFLLVGRKRWMLFYMELKFVLLS